MKICLIFFYNYLIIQVKNKMLIIKFISLIYASCSVYSFFISQDALAIFYPTSNRNYYKVTKSLEIFFMTNIARKKICQSDIKDESVSPESNFQRPYISCVNNALIKIITGNLELSNATSCPLQFSGTNRNNHALTCKGLSLVNNDATENLKALCDGKSKCFFTWKELPSLACVDSFNSSSELQYAPFNKQLLNLVHKCNTKRPQCNFFLIKSYVKFFLSLIYFLF